MPVDPSIPLAAQGPQPVTLNSIAQLMQMQQEAQQMKQSRAIQNSLAAIYANPQNLGPDGMPNAQAIQQIGKISPQTAQELTTQRATVDEKLALTGNHQLEAQKAAGDLVQDTVYGPALNAYDSALAQGKTPQQAKQIAQGIYSQGMDDAFASGAIPDEAKARAPRDFDPIRVRASSLSYKDAVSLQEKKFSDQRADQRMVDQDKRSDRQFDMEEARFGLAEHNSERADRTQAQIAEALSKLSPEARADAADKLAAGLPTGLPMRGGSAAAMAVEVANDAARRQRGNTGGVESNAVQNMQQAKADTQSISKAVSAFATGTQGDTVRSVNVSMNHLDTMRQAAAALKNGDTKLFNDLSQKISEQTGHPAPTNFDSLKEIVGDEVAKGVIGAGGGQGDRDAIKKGLDRAGSPDQLFGTMDSYQQLLGGQLQGLKQQYESSTKRDDFDRRLLSAKARELLPKDEGSSKTLNSSASGALPVPKVGDVQMGYVFKGGDPSKKENWEKQ